MGRKRPAISRWLPSRAGDVGNSLSAPKNTHRSGKSNQEPRNGQSKCSRAEPLVVAQRRYLRPLNAPPGGQSGGQNRYWRPILSSKTVVGRRGFEPPTP